MRMSRRSVLTKRPGVRWHKWSCIKSTNSYYTTQLIYSNGPVSMTVSDSYTGHTLYFQDPSTGYFENRGEMMTLGYGDYGTIYDAQTTTMLVSVTVSNTIRYDRIYNPILYTSTTYSKGATSYGNVYADEGAYPDATAGYTYVTHFSSGGIDYKVMRSGTTYYCYNLA